MKKCSTAGRASALKRQGTISTVVATDVPSMCNQLESKKSKEESKTDSPEAHLYSTPNESSYMGAAEKSGADDIGVGSISRDGTPFVFYGQVVRISEKVFERWKCAYPHIADLFGMLQQRDDFLMSLSPEARKNWFHSTSAWLNNRNQEIAEKQVRKPYRTEDSCGYL